jgi:hypothetical protein
MARKARRVFPVLQMLRQDVNAQAFVDSHIAQPEIEVGENCNRTTNETNEAGPCV